jgi:hypothetical protein
VGLPVEFWCRGGVSLARQETAGFRSVLTGAG